MGWIILIIIIILILPLVILFSNKDNDGQKLIEKSELIKFGMTKEQVFQILDYAKPREVTQNISKRTERYRWTAGENVYTRTYIKGARTSIGSSSHGRRHLTVVFKDGKVIEVSVK